MLTRILFGYVTQSISEEPTILYCGLKGTELQAAVDNADPEFVRLRIAEVSATRPARRTAPPGEPEQQLETPADPTSQPPAGEPNTGAPPTGETPQPPAQGDQTQPSTGGFPNLGKASPVSEPNKK